MRQIARAGLRRLGWETRQRVLELWRTIGPKRLRSALWDAPSIAGNPKHLDPTKQIDRLIRYEHLLGHQIDFQGKTVLEVGAGPMLGWAMVALARGAARYYVLEPGFHARVLDAYPSYFKSHRAWLRSVVGEVDEVKHLIDQGLIQVITAGAAHTGLPDDCVDLVLSNSVLEHVHDLSEVARELDRITTRPSVQYHTVDFSDHDDKEDPFRRLYPYHPDELRRLFARRGLPINLLRASDIESVFRERFEVERTVLLEDSSYPSVRHPKAYWSEHYPPAELAIIVATLTVRKRAAAPTP